MNQQPFSCRQSSGQPSWEPHVPPDYGRPPQSGQSPGSPSSQGWPDRSNGASQLQKLPSLFQCSKAAAKKKHVGIGYSLGCGLLILLCSFFTYVATVGGSGKTASASTPPVLVFNGAG